MSDRLATPAEVKVAILDAYNDWEKRNPSVPYLVPIWSIVEDGIKLANRRVDQSNA